MFQNDFKSDPLKKNKQINTFQVLKALFIRNTFIMATKAIESIANEMNIHRGNRDVTTFVLCKHSKFKNHKLPECRNA